MITDKLPEEQHSQEHSNIEASSNVPDSTEGDTSSVDKLEQHKKIGEFMSMLQGIKTHQAETPKQESWWTMLSNMVNMIPAHLSNFLH